jgi:hypothetical protein
MTQKDYGAKSTLSFRRGDIVAATAGGRFLVWTVGDDLVAAVLGKSGYINPIEPMRRLRFHQVIRCGRATEDQLAAARETVAGMPEACAAMVKARERYEPDWDDVYPDGPVSGARHFWDGDQFADGCGWKR